MMFLELRKLGNICCGHKNFLNKIRNNFCAPDTKFMSATNVGRAGKQENICVGNNVSSFTRNFKQMDLYFTFEFRCYLDLFTVPVGLRTCSSYICNSSVQFQIKIRRISLRHLHSPKYTERSHFAEDGKEMYKDFITHVHSYCSCH